MVFSRVCLFRHTYGCYCAVLGLAKTLVKGAVIFLLFKSSRLSIEEICGDSLNCFA